MVYSLPHPSLSELVLSEGAVPAYDHERLLDKFDAKKREERVAYVYEGVGDPSMDPPVQPLRLNVQILLQ
jgi:hypothetical protein